MPPHIDPFGLLGVGPSSSIAELRRAYFRMALICHPDKGGAPEEMAIVQGAYEWIRQQLEAVSLEGAKGTWEERKEGFDAFLAEQMGRSGAGPGAGGRDLPDMQGVEMEVGAVDEAEDARLRAMIRGHVGGTPYADFIERVCMQEVFRIRARDIMMGREGAPAAEVLVGVLARCSKAGDLIPCAIGGGYGDAMCTPVDRAGRGIEDPMPFGSREVVMYQEQEPFALARGRSAVPFLPTELPVPDALDDYSKGAMTDYRAAYSSPEAEWEGLDRMAGAVQPRSLEALVAEREAMVHGVGPSKVELGIPRDAKEFV